MVVPGTDLETRQQAEEAERARKLAEEEAVRKAQAEAAKRAADELAARTSIASGNVITRINFPAYTATYPALRGTKLPLLFPARKNATIENVTALPSAPAIRVYRNSGTQPILIPGGNGRKTQTCLPQGVFAWDGRMFYRVIARGDHYYPAEMERVLWRAVLGRELLPPGSTASAAFDLSLNLTAGGPDSAQADAPRLDIGAQYLLIFEAVPITDIDGEPNIGAGQTPVLLGEYRIPVSSGSMTNNFGVKLARNSSGESSSQTTGLNSTQSGPTLPDNFALRCRLSCFDVDDTTPDPRGTLTVSMPATVLTIDKA